MRTKKTQSQLRLVELWVRGVEYRRDGGGHAVEDRADEPIEAQQNKDVGIHQETERILEGFSGEWGAGCVGAVTSDEENDRAGEYF